MFRCVRESTSNVYQSKWLTFCNWCRGRGVAPVNASVPLIVDFFRHLVRDKGLSVPAVRGYRASLNSVFTLKGRDLAASREVSMLFRSFSKSARPERLRPPNCDVSLVLQSLTCAPYEPLRSADERFLAQKMLLPPPSALESSTLFRTVYLIRGPGVKRLLSLSRVLWRRPKTLHLGILASVVLLFQPYRKRVIILMRDFCVLYVQSSCTCAEPLRIVPRVSGSSLPQVQTPRR